MTKKQIVAGKIVSGAGQAAFFTQLDWVRRQCREKLGFTPYPGTLNLEIPEEQAGPIESLRRSEDMALIPPDANYCRAQLFPVTIDDIQGAIVVPAAHVQIHAKNILEVIAPVSLKAALGLNDGDIVRITIGRHAKRGARPRVRAREAPLNGAPQ